MIDFFYKEARQRMMEYRTEDASKRATPTLTRMRNSESGSRVSRVGLRLMDSGVFFLRAAAVVARTRYHHQRVFALREWTGDPASACRLEQIW